MARTSTPTEYLAIAQRNIDAQLHHIEEKHRALREQRNNLSYVSRLPPEILCAIFQLFIDGVEGSTTTASASHWYSFSHVCTAWRTTAIHNPALWNHITFRQPMWTQEMLRRSKKLPLDVQITPATYTNSSAAAVDCALEQSYRISNLHLATSSYVALSHLTSQLRGPFYTMRSLSISISFQDIPMIIVPDIFNDENFPVLENLSFHGCGFNWAGILPSTLISLSVAYDSTLSRTTEPRMRHVFDILRSTPRLSSLTLLWSLAIDEEDEESPGYDQDTAQPLTLNHLTHLRIVDNAPALTRFLPGIRLPPDARVHIGCQSSSGSSVIEFGTAVKHCSLVSKHRQIASLIIDQISAEHIHFVARSLDDIPGEIRIDVTWTHWGDMTGETAMSDLCQIFDLSGVIVVYTVDVGPVDHEIWRTTFSCARCMSTLCVRGDPTLGLLQALYDDPVKTAQPSFLPALRTLILEKIEFQKETKVLLFQCLTRRRESGIGLQTVAIHRSSGFGPDDLIVLESLVPEASWDGQPYADTTSEEEVDALINEESSGYGTEYSSLDDFDYQD